MFRCQWASARTAPRYSFPTDALRARAEHPILLGHLLHHAHLHLGARLHGRKRLYVAECAGEHVARAREPRFVALADRGAAEADGDRRAVGAIRDLAPRD